MRRHERPGSDGSGVNPGPRPRLSRRTRDSATSYAFLAPFLITFAVFLAFPVFYSLYLALHQVPADSFDIFGGLEFVAFRNFAKLFADTKFWWSVLMTLYYAALIIPAGIVASLVLALVVGIVWTLIYSPHVGILTRIFESVGITTFSERGFLGMPASAMPSVVFANVLKGAGFGMILYLSAIQNIPRSLYEAAEIDGATPWKRFTAITLPLVKPITLFMVIIGTIGALNAFAEVYAMTGGGPNVDVGGRALGATWVTGYYVFDTFYTQFKLGYAAAMSYVLLALTLIISLVNRRFLRSEV